MGSLGMATSHTLTIPSSLQLASQRGCMPLTASLVTCCV
jgi:hypothetical protein